MTDFHVIERDRPYLFLRDAYELVELDEDLVQPLLRLERGGRAAGPEPRCDARRLDAMMDYVAHRAAPAARPPPRIDLLGIYLIVSQHCPLRCEYCYADFGRYGQMVKGRMDFDTARRAIDILYQLNPNPEYIQFFGGEPLLNQKLIVEVVEYLEGLRAAGAIAELPSFSLVTSLSVPVQRSLLDVIARTNFAVVVSLDGPREIHDRLRFDTRKAGTHDRVMRGLENLASEGIRPSVEATYTGYHMERISPAELYQYLHATLDYRTIFVKPVVLTRSEVLRIADQPRWNALYDEAMEMLVARMCGDDPIYAGDLEYMANTYLEECVHGPNYYLCPDASGIGQVVVHSNGDVYPCYTVIGEPTLKMGNVRQFDRPAFESKQRRFRALNKDNPDCRSCWARNFCTVCLSEEIEDDYSRYGFVDFGKCDWRRRRVDRFLSAMIGVQRDRGLARQFNENFQMWHRR